MARTVRIPAFAKINLGLHILFRRPDGYHELRTIFQSIGLHDTLEISFSSRPGIRLSISDATLSTGRDNLVYRALNVMRRELGIRRGIAVQLEKSIPVARGLGGGSSDAAAAMIGLLRLTQRNVPLPRLMELAASLGADVPFFLFGGRALAAGRGDELYPLPDTPARTVLVVSPSGVRVATPDAYRWASSQLTKRNASNKLWSFCALSWSTQGPPVVNDFESAVFPRHPRLAAIRRELLRQGAAEASLAGSGSAVFGLFHHPAKARRAALCFANDQTFVVETISRARYARAMGWRPGI